MQEIVYMASWASSTWKAPYPGIPGIPAPFRRPSSKLFISGASGQQNLYNGSEKKLDFKIRKTYPGIIIFPHHASLRACIVANVPPSAKTSVMLTSLLSKVRAELTWLYGVISDWCTMVAVVDGRPSRGFCGGFIFNCIASLSWRGSDPCGACMPAGDACELEGPRDPP